MSFDQQTIIEQKRKERKKIDSQIRNKIIRKKKYKKKD